MKQAISQGLAVAAAIWLLGSDTLTAAEPTELETMLARPVLEADQALIDVQLYCVGRIPKMPEMSSSDV